METRRAGTTLAACALIALGACSREVGDNAEVKPLGSKLNGAIERAGQKLSSAGERAREGVAHATEKTQDAISRAGDNPATTTTLSSGPTTSVKVTGIPPDTRAALNDAAITASIKADLLRDPDLSVLKIEVETRDGVVTLNGLAGNDAAKARAEKMAQSVKGVREVRNHLATKQA